jgi:ABC-type multidrug transport system fused ATPase/permease subunit
MGGPLARRGTGEGNQAPNCMADDSPSVLQHMLLLVRPYRNILLRVLAFLVAVSFLNLTMPKIVGYVIDNVFGSPETGGLPLVPEERVGLLARVLVVILAVYIVKNILFYTAKTRVIVVGERVAFELRQRLIQHLHTLSVDFYQQNKPGKISARVLQDVQSIRQFIQEELANMMIDVFMLLVAAGILFAMDPVLALVTLGILPFHVLVYYLFRKPILAYAREAKERMADVSGDLIEQFDGATTVKASATQLIEQEKFRSTMRKTMRAQIKQGRFYLLQKVSADLLVGVGLVILFGWGGYSVLYRGMSPGDFVAFYGYVWLLYPRVITLVGVAGKFSKASTSVERVFEMLAIEPGVKDDPKAVPFEIGRGRIEFRNVTFSYKNGNILEDVSFTVHGGEHVLITGPSGAGKSTCVNLIPRFYDPGRGSILIDGVDVRDFTLTSLRRQIGFVFQDCFLFNDTIMANIRYAWPQASDDAVIEAARKAYADEFVEKLPNGYMTMIGEGGVQLSQGEKRRLMIARAILKNPKILILDEPLVSLDEDARRRAVEGLSGLIGNRTVLTITHYPAELPFAVKRIHVSDGRVSVRDLSGEDMA